MEKATSEKQRENAEWLFDNFLALKSRQCEKFLSELEQGSESHAWDNYMEKVLLNAADYGNITHTFLVKLDGTVKFGGETTADSFFYNSSQENKRDKLFHFNSAFYRNNDHANELWSFLANLAAFYIDWDFLDRKFSELTQRCKEAQKLIGLIKKQSIGSKQRKRLQQELSQEPEAAHQTKLLVMETFFHDDIPFEIELFLDGAARLSAYNFIQNKGKSAVRRWLDAFFGYAPSHPLVRVNALVQELQKSVKNETLQRGIATMYQNYFGGTNQESQRNSRFERSLHEWLGRDFTSQEIDTIIAEIRSSLS